MMTCLVPCAACRGRAQALASLAAMGWIAAAIPGAPGRLIFRLKNFKFATAKPGLAKLTKLARIKSERSNT